LIVNSLFPLTYSWASLSSALAGHNAKFDIDESAMAIGAEFLVGAARRFLESPWALSVGRRAEERRPGRHTSLRAILPCAPPDPSLAHPFDGPGPGERKGG